MPKTNTTIDTVNSKSSAIPPAITYRLAEKAYLLSGWTVQPSTIQEGQLAVTIKSKFAHSVISPWFKKREEHAISKYPNGKVVYFATREGTGKIFYPNGKLAIKIEKGGVNHCRTRIWVYSPGEVGSDGTKHPAQFCGLFDSLGNGVVYDYKMQKRLVYNQREGMYIDTPVGMPMHWKWHNIPYKGSMSIMNEEDKKTDLIPETPRAVMCVPPITDRSSDKAQKLSNLSMSDEDKTHLTSSEIEFRENFERFKYIDTGKIMPKQVSQIKPIVMKINEYISLRIYSQSNVSLKFFAKGRQTKMKIGVLYNPQEKLKVTPLERRPSQGEIIFPYECYPAQTKSTLYFKKLISRLKP